MAAAPAVAQDFGGGSVTALNRPGDGGIAVASAGAVTATKASMMVTLRIYGPDRCTLCLAQASNRQFTDEPSSP